MYSYLWQNPKKIQISSLESSKRGKFLAKFHKLLKSERQKDLQFHLKTQWTRVKFSFQTFTISPISPKPSWRALEWTSTLAQWLIWSWHRGKVHRCLPDLRWSPARSFFETSQILKNWKWKTSYTWYLKLHWVQHFLTKDSWTPKENVHHSYVLLIRIVVSLTL